MNISLNILVSLYIFCFLANKTTNVTILDLQSGSLE